MSDTHERVYACDRCGEGGIKLWRESNTFNPDLLCVTCLGTTIDVETVGEDGTRYDPRSGVTTDQLGWWVPAVQVLSDRPALAFWGYTSTPPEDYQYWAELPLRWKEARDG